MPVRVGGGRGAKDEGALVRLWIIIDRLLHGPAQDSTVCGCCWV